MCSAQSVWSGGDAYEPYVGRWSRLIAREFLDWLNIPSQSKWLDIGCGTGALVETILEIGDPEEITGIDPSEGYLDVARTQITDQRVNFDTGDARNLLVGEKTFDVAVSGLVLNFIPHVESGVAEMRRTVNEDGKVAAYVWDYADKMELMRYFWDSVVELKPQDWDKDEGVRFPICRPEALTDVFKQAGLKDIEVKPLDVSTRFVDFDDYWSPFLGGQFPAPDYAMSLSEADRDRLREHIRRKLPFNADGSINLIARAWAVQGSR